MLKTDPKYFKNTGTFLKYVWPFFNKMHERVKGFITLSEKLQRKLPNVFGGVTEKYEKRKEIRSSSSSNRNISQGS